LLKYKQIKSVIDGFPRGFEPIGRTMPPPGLRRGNGGPPLSILGPPLPDMVGDNAPYPAARDGGAAGLQVKRQYSMGICDKTPFFVYFYVTVIIEE
jgi:hypothetical protein